jgi:hypothetical protein
MPLIILLFGVDSLNTPFGIIIVVLCYAPLPMDGCNMAVSSIMILKILMQKCREINKVG